MHLDLLVDLSNVCQNLNRNGLSGRMSVRKPFLRKGNSEKRLAYAKLYKNWTKNMWQQLLQNENFSFKSLSV